MFEIADKHGVSVHMYADDTQLYVSFEAEQYDQAIDKLQACIEEMCTWLSNNHLKLNEDKTEFIIIGAKQVTNRITGSKSIRIGDAVI